jgi:hypothetical protein
LKKYAIFDPNDVGLLEKERLDMEEFKKIVALDNEIQARLMDSILTEREIPHRMRSYHDSAYDGIFQTQKGWGIIQAPIEYKEEILAILADPPLEEKEKQDQE